MASIDAAQAGTQTPGQRITSLLGTGGAATGAAARDGSAEGTEDRFLKLLVAQMRNQDPLNPLDNAQVTTQMAQISTVRGVETLNQSMRQLVDRMGQGSPLEALGMIGRQVLAEGGVIEREASTDGPVRAGIELAGPADRVEVRIVDANGQPVFSQSWGASEAGVKLFEWNGKDGWGNDAPAGSYRIEATASAGGAAVGVTTLAPIRVLGITPGADGVRIELSGQRAVSAQDIKAII